MISICVKNLNKRYRARDGDVPALADVDIEVAEGEFVTIVGPSGCGKSTLLYILGGFLGADGGTIEVNGKAVTGPGVDRGIVFQEYALFPWLTVAQNIRYGLEINGTARKECEETVERLVRTIGLLTREGMQDELLRLWQATRKTVVMVTHDVNEAVYLSGRVLVMSQRPGRIVQEFPVTIDRTGEREVTVLNDDFNHLRNEVWLAVRRQAGANAGASGTARDA
jgi:NitT/TauT family transport system ATP-binding protein